MSPEEDVFLTVAELLARWHIDRRTLEKLMTDGGLAYLEYPAPVRVRRFKLSLVLLYEQKYFRSSSGMPV